MHVSESLWKTIKIWKTINSKRSRSRIKILFLIGYQGGVDIERHIIFKLKYLSRKNAEVNDDLFMIL